jgi:Ca2+-transporting ATPase
VIGAVTLGVGFAYYALDLPEWQTMMFTTLAFMQVGQAFATRSNTESLRRIGWSTNRVMLGVAALVVGLQLLTIYSPLREFLDLDTLDVFDVAICAALGVALLVLVEAVKWVQRRRAQPADHR